MIILLALTLESGSMSHIRSTGERKGFEREGIKGGGEKYRKKGRRRERERLIH